MNNRRNATRIYFAATLITLAYGYYCRTLNAKTKNVYELENDENLVCKPELEISSAYTPPALDMTPGARDPSLPSSLTIIRDQTVVRLAPRRSARRRGVVMKDARLRPYASTRGPGCRDVWYKIHADSWICGDRVRASDLPPWGFRYPVVPKDELTPWAYGFVREPTIEYRLRGGVLEETRDVLKGFGFGVERRVSINGTRFFKTAENTLIPRASAGISGRISEFSGIEIKDGAPWPVGFVNSRKAWAYSTPSLQEHFRIGKVERYMPFQVRGFSGKGRKRFYRFDEKAWLHSRDVKVGSEAPLPKGVAKDERWIDVDTKQQIITAYEGAMPVYVTLVSTGRIGASRTVKGEFRIWAKIAAIAMDNTDEELEESEEGGADAGPAEERKLYSLHDVPWVQFFFESYGLHGVYWHDRFGNRRSHGCVNLAPIDARWFYDWTAPYLPDGWWAMHSSPNDKGTLIRVR